MFFYNKKRKWRSAIVVIEEVIIRQRKQLRSFRIFEIIGLNHNEISFIVEKAFTSIDKIFNV